VSANPVSPAGRLFPNFGNSGTFGSSILGREIEGLLSPVGGGKSGGSGRRGTSSTPKMSLTVSFKSLAVFVGSVFTSSTVNSILLAASSLALTTTVFVESATRPGVAFTSTTTSSIFLSASFAASSTTLFVESATRPGVAFTSSTKASACFLV